MCPFPDASPVMILSLTSSPSSFHPSHSQSAHHPGQQMIRHLGQQGIQAQCRKHSNHEIIRHITSFPLHCQIHTIRNHPAILRRGETINLHVRLTPSIQQGNRGETAFAPGFQLYIKHKIPAGIQSHDKNRGEFSTR